MAVYTDQMMIGYTRSRAIQGPWPAVGRFLVCVRPGPTAEAMVRAAYRLVTRFDADFIVLSVDSVIIELYLLWNASGSIKL